MRDRSSATPRDEGCPDYGVSTDETFTVLGNERRRLVLGYLQHADETAVEVGDLATSIAAWERDKSPSEISYDERKAVRTSLHQLHLPKMEEVGFVEFDKRCGTVTLTDAGANLVVAVGFDSGSLTPRKLFVVFVVGTTLSALVLWWGVSPNRDGGTLLVFWFLASLAFGLLLSVAYDRWASATCSRMELPVPQD